MHTNLFAKNRKLHNLQLPILISKKSIISNMHHPAMYMYINFQQKQASIDQSKPCTQIYLQIIINCINLQLAIRISKNRSFQKWITQFSRSKPILRSIDSVDLLEPRSKVISTDDGHVRNVSRNLKSNSIYNTRCTRGDASSFFLYLQNVFVCIKRNIWWRYSNIVLKIILNCMNLQIATQLIMMFIF